MFERPVNLKNPSETTLHDESRQGEALLLESSGQHKGRKLYRESYGCAMNVSDSEIVASIMQDMGFHQHTSHTNSFNFF